MVPLRLILWVMSGSSSNKAGQLRDSLPQQSVREGEPAKESVKKSGRRVTVVQGGADCYLVGLWWEFERCSRFGCHSAACRAALDGGGRCLAAQP